MENQKSKLTDIEATIGDSSALAYDQLISMIMNGNSSMALSKLDRLLASGQTSAGLATLLGRHLSRLYKIRALIESGRSANDAVNSLRPPVHFKQKDSIAHQANRLDLPTLKKAIHVVQETVSRSRMHANLDLTGTERMILILSKMSRNRR